MSKKLTFSDLYSAIEPHWAYPKNLSLSELHGYLCGLLCGHNNPQAISAADWLEQEILPSWEDDPNSAYCYELLMNLHDYSLNYLHNMDFEFALLLPDDDADLELRIQELGLWCCGFSQALSEIAENADSNTPNLSEDALDALDYLKGFAEFDCVSSEDAEADEKAFMEVHEYIRMGALMIFAELNADNTGEAAKGLSLGDRNTLH